MKVASICLREGKASLSFLRYMTSLEMGLCSMYTHVSLVHVRNASISCQLATSLLLN